MDFRQLEAYINVYEQKGFTKAAEEMFLSQPSISAYITALEKELGTQLICRSTKEFIPTKAGAMFYGYAKEMLSLREQSILSVKDTSDSNFGRINILASSVPAQYILPKMLGDFHRMYPNIVFYLTQADSAGVVKGIASYKGDVGFVGAKIKNEKCVYKEFMSEQVVLIAPYEDRYRETPPEAVAQMLRTESFVIRESGSGTRLQYEEFLKKIGVELDELQISAQLNNTQSIIQAVAGGLGLSIVSEFAARPYIQQRLITPIDVGFLSERDFYIVLKKTAPKRRLLIHFWTTCFHIMNRECNDKKHNALNRETLFRALCFANLGDCLHTGYKKVVSAYINL